MRYIDADALKVRVHSRTIRCGSVLEAAYMEVEALIDEAETADVAPVKRGKWEPINEAVEDKESNGLALYRCSACGRRSLQHRMGDRFCSQCGAEMQQSPGFIYRPFYGKAP